MRKKDQTSEVVGVRIKNALLERVRQIQKQGDWTDQSENAFLGYLVGLGITRYERSILPYERGDDLVQKQAGALPETEPKVC